MHPQLVAQTPVLLMESTFKISSLSEETFQFGLCEGDHLLIEFNEKKGKKVERLVLRELEGITIFQDYQFSEISKKKIKISKTAIYEIAIKNRSAAKRTCYLQLSRLPATEAFRNFNSTVYSRIIRDTTYKTKKKPFVRYQGVKPVILAEKNLIYLDNRTKAIFPGANSKVVVTVNLPINTVEWYYQFSSYRNKDKINSVNQTFDLIGNISKVLDRTGLVKLGIQMLTHPPGGDICSVYLLDASNSHAFKNTNSWRYQQLGSRENYNSGIVKIKQLGGGTQYIGIQNPELFHGINVLFEVVAIVADFNTGIEEIQKPIIKSKREFYLKN